MFALLTSCYKRNATTIEVDSDTKTLQLAPDKSDELKLSSLVDTFEITAFETIDESVMGTPAKMEFDDNTFFLLDNQVAKAVLLFDKNGAFLRKVRADHKEGHKAFEITSFALDKEKKQIITCENNVSIARYGYDGVFVSRQPFKWFFKDMALVNRDLLAMHASKLVNYTYSTSLLGKKTSKPVGYNLFLRRGEDDPEGLYPFDLNVFTNGVSYNDIKRPFFQYQDQTLYTAPFNDTIVNLTGDKLSARYIIDFGSKRSTKTLANMNADEVLKYYLSDPEEAFFVHNFLETDEMAKFDFFLGNTMQSAFVSKRNGKKVSGKVKNDLFGLDVLLDDAVGNQVVAIVQPERLHQLLKEESSKNSAWFQTLSNICENIKSDQNSIIFKFKFKNL